MRGPGFLRNLSLFFVVISLGLHVDSKASKDTWLEQLNREISKRDVYLNEKLDLIQQYKAAIPTDDQGKFKAYLNIYNAYKTLIYDSAFTYACKLQDVAYRLGDPEKIALVSGVQKRMEAGPYAGRPVEIRELCAHRVP